MPRSRNKRGSKRQRNDQTETKDSIRKKIQHLIPRSRNDENQESERDQSVDASVDNSVGSTKRLNVTGPKIEGDREQEEKNQKDLQSRNDRDHIGDDSVQRRNSPASCDAVITAQDENAKLPDREEDQLAMPSKDKCPSPSVDRISIHWSEHKMSASVDFIGDRCDPLCLVGRARLRCLEGRLWVLGYQLNAGDGSDIGSGSHENGVEVISPPWSSHVTLTNPEPGTKIEITSVRAEADGSGSLQPTFRFLEPAKARPNVIPTNWSNAADSIVRNFTSNRSSRDAYKFEAENLQTFQKQNGIKTTNPSGRESTAAPREDSTAAPQPNRNRKISRVAVCGTKGVGKSTCLRYTANRLLSSGYGAIAVLDTDLGQPEFTPPGVLSLSIVGRPLGFVPPFWNLIQMYRDHRNDCKPSGSIESKSECDGVGHSPFLPAITVASCYFGSVTPKDDPNRYVECVRYLMTQYREQLCPDGNEFDLPLIVNTHGWVRGLGYQIMSTLFADIINPSHVLQISGTSKFKSVDVSDIIANIVPNSDGSSTTLHAICAFNNIDPTQRADGLECAQRYIPSPVSSDTLRCLRFGAYFIPDPHIWDALSCSNSLAGLVDDECLAAQRLAACAPYCVPFYSIRFGLFGDDNLDVRDEHMVLDALNGSIVGLCCYSDDSNSDASSIFNPNNPYNINGEPLECLGLGIIRSIDRIRRCFYILTPVPQLKLSEISILCGGDVQLPPALFIRGVHSESFPYLKMAAGDGDGPAPLGADPMKSRNNIGRKSTSQGHDARRQAY